MFYIQIGGSSTLALVGRVGNHHYVSLPTAKLYRYTLREKRDPDEALQNGADSLAD